MSSRQTINPMLLLILLAFTFFTFKEPVKKIVEEHRTAKVNAAINELYGIDPKTTEIAKGIKSRVAYETISPIQKVAIPVKPKEPIVINNTDNNTQLKVNIPNTAETKDGRQSTDGTILFKEAAKDTDIAIQPLADESVKALIKINSAEAPTSFNFPVTIPEGGRLMLLDDGSVLVLDNQDNPLSTIDKPWAKDSNLVAVPTHFEVDPTGTKLTQVVDYKTGNYAFPIAADPWYKPWTWGVTKKAINVTKTVWNNPTARNEFFKTVGCVLTATAAGAIALVTAPVTGGASLVITAAVIVTQGSCILMNITI